MARIFLSHSSANDSEAAVLRDWLTAEGWDDLFLDLDPTRGIAAGERWELALNEAANRCEAVLFLVSRAWLSSRWCLKELSLAQKLNKRIFGILVENIAVEDLPADLTATHQLVNLAAGSDHRMLSGRGKDGEAVRVTFSQSGLAKLKTGLTRAGLDARFFLWPPEDDPGRSPYRGLKPLEAEDAGIFFGREAPTIEALDKMRGLAEGAPPRLMAILGASGAGKSSFLRAGLAPRLMRDDRSFLMLPIVRPERRALHGEAGLVRCFEEAAKAHGLGLSRADIRTAVEAGPPAIATLIGEIAAKAAVPDLDGDGPARLPRVVLAVDQGEELFLSEGCEEAAAFLALIRDLAKADHSNLIVLFTIRSDSFEQLQTAPELDGLSLQTFNLPPMPRGAYQTVIEGPAKRLADSERMLTIEPALTEALLADIEEGGGKDALPLLAFTLERLYEEYGTGGKATLTLAQYRELGGIRGSIEAAVKDALSEADADPAVPKDPAARLVLLRRSLIPWLAGIDPETGSPRRRVARLSEIPEEARPLVEHLIAARLLSTDVAPDTGERTVEPAHEALLRQWGLLQGWLEEDFTALTTLEGIRRAASDWAANAKDEAWLAHTAGRLEDAEAVARRDDFSGLLEPTDRAYLAAARAAETARRDRELNEARMLAAAQKEAADRQKQVAQRTRMGLIAASILAVAAIGAAVFGFEKAVEARHEAAAAQAQRTVAEQKTREAQAQKLVAEQKTKEAQAQKTIAEQKTKEAQAQKLVAEQQTKIAQAQRKLAEQKTKEAQAQKLLAEQQTKVAQAQKVRAQRAVRSATDTANTLIFDLAEKFRGTTGIPASMIQAILEPALKLQSSLIDAGENNPQLRRSQAVALREMADTLLTIGDTKAALAAAKKARHIVLGLLAQRPDDLFWKRDLSISLTRIGDAEMQAGNQVAALAAYRKSLGMARELAKANNNRGAQRDLSISLNDVGYVELQMGDLAGALAAYTEGLTIARKLAEDKGNAQAQRDLSISLTKIGDVKIQLGDLKGALAVYEESVGITRKLAKDKSNAQAQRDLSIGLNNIGYVDLQSGNPAKALAAYKESLGIRRMLAMDKSNAQAQSDLAISLDKIGDVKDQTGDLKGALAAYEEALGIRREVAKDKSNAQAQRDVSVSLERIGDVKLKEGDRAGALAAYKEDLAISRALAADKGNAQAQGDLAVSLDKMGNVKARSGDMQGALAAYTEGLVIRRGLARDKSNAQAQRDLSISLNNIGYVDLHTGDLARAMAAYAESVTIVRRLAEDKSDARAQRDLSVTLNDLGDVKVRMGDRKGALAVYMESVGIARELAKDKGDARAQRDLSISLDNVAGLERKVGNNTAALAAYEESLGIERQLAKDKGNPEAQRDLSISLNNVGDVKMQLGDPKGALAVYEQSTAIARVLAGNKSNAQAQRDLSISLNRLGNAKSGLGDKAGALTAYDEGLVIARRLASNGGNVGAQMDLVFSLARVASVAANPRPTYEEALHIVQTLDAQGRLNASQKRWIGWINGDLARLDKARATPAATAN